MVNAETLTGPTVANVPTSHDHSSVFARIQAWPNVLNTFTATYGFSGHAYANRDAGGFNLAERGIAAEKQKHTLTLSHRMLRASNWQNDVLFGFIDQGDHAGSAAIVPAVDVHDVRALAARDEGRRAAHGTKRAHRTVHAARNDTAGGIEQTLGLTHASLSTGKVVR